MLLGENVDVKQYLNDRTWAYDYRNKSFIDKASGRLLGFKFDPDTDTFITSGGVHIKISPISIALILEYQDKLRGELQPEMPTKRIQYGDKDDEFELVGDPDNPQYRRDLGKFLSLFSIAIMKYILCCSVENDIPQKEDWSRKMKALVNMHGVSSTDEEGLLYCWVYSLLKSEAETEALTVICQGRSLVTKESIELVEGLFPN